MAVEYLVCWAARLVFRCVVVVYCMLYVCFEDMHVWGCDICCGCDLIMG